jgi:glycosyltransferase involved in cell wall biosynthesis
VITLGRFVPDKQQLAQIQIAAALPDWPFHIVGYAGNGAYYRQCELAVKRHSVGNVHLRPDIPFDQARAALAESRYFLHTMVGEPFGLSAVEAVAAGCLPLVHRSGGQRETIPLPQLQYDEMAEVPRKLLALGEADATQRADWLAQLQQHATNEFDAPVFDERIKAILREYL